MIEVVKDLKGELAIPDNFSRTVQAYNPNKPQPYAKPRRHTNPQTTELCALLGLTDLCAKAAQLSEGSGRAAPGEQEGEEEYGKDGQSTGSADEPSEYPSDTSGMSRSINPDEITIEDEWEEEPGEQEVEELGGVPAVKPAGEVQPPRKTPMVLPQPKLDGSPSDLSHLMELTPPSHSTPTVAQSQQCDDEDEDSAAVARMLKRTSEEAGDSSGKGIPPRIKRRNQVIYSVMDGEDDEEEEEAGGRTAPVS